MLVIVLLILLLVFLVIYLSKEMKEEKSRKERGYFIEVRPEGILAEKFGKNFNIDYYAWRDRNDALCSGYKIAGINFRHLDDSYIGEFDGFVKLEENNKYDRFAIAIYKGRKKVGYIPRDSNQELHEELSHEGGKASCKGYIYTFINEYDERRFAGEVVVLSKDDTEAESYSN